MTKRLKRIAPLQLGKMLAITYGLISLVFVPFFALFATIMSFLPHAEGAPAVPAALGVGMGLGFMIFLPLMYAAMGFITGLLGAVVYNLVAKWIGGIEVEVE